MDFSQIILSWYHEHKRQLPWRQTVEPYNIWLSEIMLQQTRVAQGLPYYEKFIAAFPTIFDLAAASEQEVLNLWQGLGYYSRARNMHATAKTIVEEFNGRFPDSYKGLLQLKGVGEYTASAIASICYNEPCAVVDGNVYRVLSRYFGVSLPINTTQGIAHFKALATKVMHTENIRDYNQGIMEFGAMQCAPKKPYCLHCPLQEGCVALQTNSVHQLPVKLKKTKIKKRFFNYIVAVDSSGTTTMEQRQGKGIWQGLYQFPLLEHHQSLTLEEFESLLPQNLLDLEITAVSRFNESPIIHKLTHQHLITTFWIVTTTKSPEPPVSLQTIEELPVPVLIADFIKRFKNDYF